MRSQLNGLGFGAVASVIGNGVKGTCDSALARWTGLQPYGVEATGSLGAPAGGLFGYDNNPASCPMSSAAEGNANQQHFPVKQYGQTTGGNRC